MSTRVIAGHSNWLELANKRSRNFTGIKMSINQNTSIKFGNEKTLMRNNLMTKVYARLLALAGGIKKFRKLPKLLPSCSSVRWKVCDENLLALISVE